MIFGVQLLFAALLQAPAAITVCLSGCEYQSIQAAIDAAPAGARIQVRGGDYSGQSIVIEKAITLEGENWPVISGNGKTNVLSIRTSNVRIAGLDIRGSGVSYLEELAAIRVEGASQVVIEGNRLANNAFGVYLANSDHCLVIGNDIKGSYLTESESGNGVHSWSGAHHRIVRNHISGHRDGIYLEFTNDSEITDNAVRANVRYGLHFMTSHRNLYQGNHFFENGAGVAVMYSRQVRMIGNVFSDNRGAASYGLLLKDISVGEISLNNFSNNTFGVYMEGTNRSKFRGNTFNENGYAVRVFADCDDNHFERNNFSGNTFDIVTNSSTNPNYFRGNYWEQYQGYDLNRDGVGDVPYRPVSLSSVLTERLDSSFVLIRSPLLILLDWIEQSLPLLTPETLKDDAPLMRPWSDNS